MQKSTKYDNFRNVAHSITIRGFLLYKRSPGDPWDIRKTRRWSDYRNYTNRRKRNEITIRKATVGILMRTNAPPKKFPEGRTRQRNKNFPLFHGRLFPFSFVLCLRNAIVEKGRTSIWQNGHWCKAWRKHHCAGELWRSQSRYRNYNSFWLM